MGIFDRSSRSAFIRLHTDFGQEGVARSLQSNSFFCLLSAMVVLVNQLM